MFAGHPAICAIGTPQTSLQRLHLIEQPFVGNGLSVAHVVRQLQIVEEAFGAFDLAGFHGAQFHRTHVTLGLGDKEDVLQPAIFTEGDDPVGSVVTDRRGDPEAARQLGVDGDFGCGFEPSRELRFHALSGVAVGEHPVLHAFALTRMASASSRPLALAKMVESYSLWIRS